MRMGRSCTASGVNTAASFSGSVFFPFGLHLRIGLGMSSVGGHFAPPVPLDQPIHHRRFHPAAQLLVQRHPQGRQHHQLAPLRRGLPIGHESLLLFPAQEGSAASSPGRACREDSVAAAPEARLQTGYGGSPDPQRRRRLLQRQTGDSRQEDGLGHAQLLHVLGLSRHSLRFDHQGGVDFSRSCHAPNIA